MTAASTACIANLAVGDELPSLRKKAYQRLLDEADFGEGSIHTDEYTRKHGYPGALISSYVITGYLSELMIASFGESWFDSGDFDIRFVGKGIQQGDWLTLRARVTRIDRLPAGIRYSFAITGEKDDTSTPVVGHASAVFRSAPSHVESATRK